MIAFPYDLFSETPDFPVHLQYGFHDKELYLHVHEDFSELVIVLNGSAGHIVGGESYHISKGDVFVVGQNTEHGYEKTQRLTICNIMFRPEVFEHAYDIRQLSGFQALFVLEPHYSQKYHFLSHLKLNPQNFTETETLITEIIQEYQGKKIGWQDMTYSGFLKLCVMLSRCYQDTDSGNTFLKLADAAAYLEHHFCEHVSMTELAEISGYSERQFFRLFKSAFQTTPNLYLAGLRMKKAQHLLQSTSLSIGEIAFKCGYDDQNYFSRAFRKYTGMTPSEYQNSMHEF
ncbi:MAG: helix-turn-helix domain-containing protein [Ruminococcus sp.]|nr:helix-turn-helix domain-containing protein [Ruminococcus sp.]